MKPHLLIRLVLLAVTAPLLLLSGCLTSPEHCHGCLAALVPDAAPTGPDGTVSETGGASGAGGVTGTGGLIGTGGAGGGSGGVSGTGGAATGGSTATGGSGTGGRGTGGSATGGSGTGGRGTGGSATGGSGTGGSGTGGSATGGTSAGGTGMGGRGTGGAAGSSLGGNGTDPDLVLWYKFDESSGTMATDASTGGAARPGTLGTLGTGATATFVTTRQVGSHAVKLTPVTATANVNGAFVTVPALQTLAPAATTIAVWVNLAANTAAENWSRVFDYGTGKLGMTNMFLTARAADSTAATPPVRFAITSAGHAAGAEQRLDGPSSLTANAWHHIAVVLPAGATYTGILYIDGVPVATNPAMTLHPGDLGATTSNWLGRSQFSGVDGTNPCLNGMLDDYRVYRRALSAAEIAVLFALR